MITVIIIAAIISAIGILQVLSAMSDKSRRRVLKHRGKINLIMHACVFYLFIGTFTGLIQAELCAIMLTIVFAAYAKKTQLEDRTATAITAIKRVRLTREQAKAQL